MALSHYKNMQENPSLQGDVSCMDKHGTIRNDFDANYFCSSLICYKPQISYPQLQILHNFDKQNALQVDKIINSQSVSKLGRRLTYSLQAIQCYNFSLTIANTSSYRVSSKLLRIKGFRPQSSENSKSEALQ